MKRKGLFAILFVCVLIAAATVYYFFFYENYSFELRAEVSVKNSTYHENGTWWGYHQSKIVSINDTTFTYYIDNSTQVNGVANVNNPNKAVLLKIKDGVTEEFARLNTSRPCNILADSVRNKIYCIVIEPTMEDSGASGKAMFYEYNFNPQSGAISFVGSEQVIASGDDDGRIRTSAAIDDSGNIAFAYGDYNATMQVYVRNIANGEWTNYNVKANDNVLIHNLRDTPFYPYLVLKDLNTFYLLAVQDTNLLTANYYQYVQFFSYENGEWNSQYIVDYRDLPIAQTKPQLVEQTELFLDGEDLHIFTRANLSEKGKSTIKHFVYKNGVITEIDATFLNTSLNWIKLVRISGKLYYVCNDFRFLEVIDYETKERVFYTKKIPVGSYIYVNKNWNESEIQVMLCTGSSSDFDTDSKILFIRPKAEQ